MQVTAPFITPSAVKTLFPDDTPVSFDLNGWLVSGEVAVNMAGFPELNRTSSIVPLEVVVAVTQTIASTGTVVGKGRVMEQVGTGVGVGVGGGVGVGPGPPPQQVP